MKLVKENIPFTMVANEVLKSRFLSWKAKGLYAYLFSKPDEWDFSSNRIVIESKDGRKAIMGALRELEDEGFLVRSKLASGKMEYSLKYSTLNAEMGLRDDPKLPFGTVPKGLSAESSPVSNIVYESNKDIAPAKPSPFVWSEYLKSMDENPRKHVQLIAEFFRERGIRFDSEDEVNLAIKRHSPAATKVIKFPEQKVFAAFDKAKTKYRDVDWTIETLLKILTN